MIIVFIQQQKHKQLVNLQEQGEQIQWLLNGS